VAQDETRGLRIEGSGHNRPRCEKRPHARGLPAGKQHRNRDAATRWANAPGDLESNQRDRRLLCVAREWPCYRAAEHRDEFASFQSTEHPIPTGQDTMQHIELARISQQVAALRDSNTA